MTKGDETSGAAERPEAGPSWRDRAAPVRRGEELDLEALAPYLRAELGHDDGEIEIEQFPRGFSNLTYLLRLGGRELVLRRPPFGADIRSAHDMGREYRILRGLSSVYPKAPRPLLYHEDPELLGAPFYVMERVRGVILRSKMPREMIPAPELMRGIGESLIATLAELHAVDPAAAGLGKLGRPEGYVRRQLEGWAGRYANARTEEIADLEAACRWLADNEPVESDATLIHNDFKYDNVVLDAGDWSRIVAVLDWEMATLGDPLMDLGTSLGYWVEPSDPPEMLALGLSPTTLPGNPTRSEVVELYERASGRQVHDPVFYYVYGLFKLAVILQQIFARYRRGDTDDPRFAGLIDGVRLCGRVAARAVEIGRIDRLY